MLRKLGDGATVRKGDCAIVDPIKGWSSTMVARVLFRRLERSLFGATWSEAWDQTNLEMWGGHWNTDDFFRADANQERLRELCDLWESNPSDAFPRFLALAEAGSVWSMIRVGCAYSAGRGVPRDKRSAEHWFDAAFNQGSDYGLIWGARMARWRGDLAKARAKLAVGVERDLLPAMVVLADLEARTARTGEDRERARNLYEGAIAKGFLPATPAYAGAMICGTFGWRNIPEGFRRLWAFAKATSDLIDEREKQIKQEKQALGAT